MDTTQRNRRPSRKKEKRLSPSYVLGGGFLKEDFVLKHTKIIVLIVVLTFLMIANRYACMQKLREIDKLEVKLRDVKFRALSLSTELTGNSRQSQIETLLNNYGSELQIAPSPPIEIHR